MIIDVIPGEAMVWFLIPPHYGYHLLETAILRTGLAAFFR
jgi:hypothetical protein